MIRILATANFRRLCLVLGSLMVSLWHFGPLQGSFVALLLTLAAQVYLFGYLSARALGVFRESENLIIRAIWIVTCGLSINIFLGAFARLVLLPVNVYVIGLHGLMALLSLAPSIVAPSIRIERKVVPFYLLVAVACIIFSFVGWERNRFWIDGYDDQSLPVSLADWWAHQSNPESLVTRHIAETNTLTYWSSDGLTYAFASWAWTGGFTAVQLIWYALTPLFAWLVPLAHFAVAYRVTQREDTAAWATGIILILALTTISGNPLYAGAWNFGQEAGFQLNTLRTFSTALLIPLTLFVFFTCLRSPKARYYLLAGVIMLALALTHPRQFLTLLTGLYAILAVNWLMMPSRVRLRRTILLGLALLPSLLVPVWQYTATLQSALRPSLLPELAATVTSTQTIIEPNALLFHPIVAAALFLSVAAVVRLRRSLAAQFIITTTAVMFIVSYVPPIINSIMRIMGSYFGLHFVLELFYLVPFGLILGITIGFLHDLLSRYMSPRVSFGNWAIAGGFAMAALALLTEPFPITQSARDQIVSANDVQAVRDIRPFDEQLLARLRTLPVAKNKVVYLIANRVSSYVIESVPNAFVTGGRAETNAAFEGSTRFFEAPDAPWLDAADIAFLQQYPVDYLVLSADNTRVPQLLLQPERFERIDTVAGYLIFAMRQIGTVTAADQTYARMNTLYESQPSPRWDADGFHLDQAPYTDLWQSVIEAWNEQLSREPTNDLARYGLAFAHLMAGDNADELWEALREAHPDVFLLTDAHAQSLRQQGQVQAAVDLLTSKLESAEPSEQVLSARALLTEPFFHVLTPEQLDTIVALEDNDSATWAQLMEWANANNLRPSAEFLEGNATKLRTRAALLMSTGRFDVAARWLERIPGIETSPSDLVARAALEMVDGNIEAARALLLPATDFDWIWPRFTLHRNRWREAPNAAARFYQMLSTSSADIISPNLITETGRLFAMQAEIERDSSGLQISLVLGNFAPALSPSTVSVQITSPDNATLYGQANFPVDVPLGSLVRVTVPVELSPDLPTPSLFRVMIAPQYSDAVIYQPLLVEGEW